VQPLAAKDREGADAGRARRKHSLSPHASISENTLPHSQPAGRVTCRSRGKKPVRLTLPSPLSEPFSAPMFTCRSLDSRGRTFTVISNRGGVAGSCSHLVFVAVF
jgi:hypothetical protein